MPQAGSAETAVAAEEGAARACWGSSATRTARTAAATAATAEPRRFGLRRPGPASDLCSKENSQRVMGAGGPASFGTRTSDDDRAVTGCGEEVC
ncbi:hypothetical protein GCM10022207_00490 [Streptomyces lannensis]|uniref:Uncharacterized protein n=1 Tax=Streptomyces lannensis TaxID=766498 RepID=A0ABP7JH36_9ACTN